MNEFVAIIPKVVTNPLALVAYLAVVLGWFLVRGRTALLDRLLDDIEHIPQEERGEVIQKAFPGSPIPESISAKDYLTLQRQKFAFYRYCLQIGVVLVTLALLSYTWQTTLVAKSITFVTPDQTPEQSVLYYWDAISQQKWALAWTLLSPDFQRIRHQNSERDFIKGWTQELLCSVTAERIQTVQVTVERARVSTHLVSQRGPACTVYEGDFEINLVASTDGKRWLIDEVAPQ
jgi:hypothetical protein